MGVIRKIFENLIKRQASHYGEVASNVILPNGTSKIPSSFHFSIIRLRANAVASLVWNVYREVGNQRVLVQPLENKIARVFWKPSPNLTTTELLSNIVFFLDYYGNAFLRIRQIKSGDFEINLLQPQLVRRFAGELVYQTEVIPQEQIVHIRNPILDWLSSKSEVSFLPSVILREHNEVLKAISQFLLRFTERSGGAPLYLSGSNLTLEQQRNVVTEWNARFPDFPLRMFLDTGEIKSLPASISFNVDALGNIVKIPMQAIAMFYGVPLGKITGENANYATAMINDYTFWTTSVKPTALLISDTLTDYFRKFEPDILIAFEDFDFSVFEAFKGGRTNVVTKAEDTFFLWRRLDTEAKTIAREFKRPFEQFWQAVKEYTFSLVEQKAFTEIANKITTEDIFALLESFLDKPLGNGIRRAILQAFREVQQSVTNYEIIETKVWMYTREQLERWCEIWTRQIQDTIQLAQDPADLQNRLEKVFAEMQKQPRIELQARQLATIALNSSLVTTFEMFPEYDIVWLSQRDGRVRPSHVSADGQKRQNGLFIVGGETLPFPGGGLIPENNVNCRCYVRPIRRENGRG